MPYVEHNEKAAAFGEGGGSRFIAMKQNGDSQGEIMLILVLMLMQCLRKSLMPTFSG